MPKPMDVAYSDGSQITWYTKDAKVKLLSNLPEEEMLKIAESVRPVEKREHKFLSNPD